MARPRFEPYRHSQFRFRDLAGTEDAKSGTGDPLKSLYFSRALSEHTDLARLAKCRVDEFIAAMLLEECSPAYVNACVRRFKALMNHAVKRRVIAALPLTEKIKFEDEDLPELELNDKERVAFLSAFDDEAAFRADIATRRTEAPVVTSPHFKAARQFGFGLNPESDATGLLLERFCSLKPVFVVALETGLRKSDLVNLQWAQVDLAGGSIRLTMKKTKKKAVCRSRSFR